MVKLFRNLPGSELFLLLFVISCCEIVANLDIEQIDFCLNGGTLMAGICTCPSGFSGSKCESWTMSFHGNGSGNSWAVMPSVNFSTIIFSHLKVEVAPRNEFGLILYYGPMMYNPKLDVRDFIALEVEEGYAVLYFHDGNYTGKISQRINKLTDGQFHTITVNCNASVIWMEVDGCALHSCIAMANIHKHINLDYPIQIAGHPLSNSLVTLASKLHWNKIPSYQDFLGCIRNLKINGESVERGNPTFSLNADLGCDAESSKTVSS